MNNELTNKDIEIENWRNEHGRPSFQYLQALASEGTIDALEKLRSIAEDLDVSFDSSTDAENLVRLIGMTVRGNDDLGTTITN